MQQNEVRQRLAQFFKGYDQKQVDIGLFLAMPGTSFPGVMYLESGLVEQYHIDKNGNRVVVHAFRPGAFFPMSWVLNQTPNEYFFEVVAVAQIRTAPPEKVIQFLLNNPEVLMNLLSRVYKGTDVLLKRLALTASASALTRLAYELVLEAYRLPVDRHGYVQIETTQAILAERSGLVRETVSRQLKHMERSGLLSTEDGIRFRPKDIEEVAGL